ncbi:MAG: CapA family protein [Dictyoglomus sp.]
MFPLITFLIDLHSQENSLETISLSFVGDLFIQRQLFNSYYDPQRKTYYFPEEIFEDIREYINKDFSSIVIDTPVATNLCPPSGYPSYNAPIEILDTLKRVGFNIMITSGNHALDKGERGLIATIENIRKRDLYYVGTNSKKEESKKYLILEKNNIKIGVLAYTFSTNGIPLPKGKEYFVNLIDREKIKKDLSKVKNLCDFKIVYLHWGDIEYLDEVEEWQKRLAKEIINYGADLIVGSHPHAIKTYENIEGKWCFYALGNFFTDQYGVYRPEVKYGYILNLYLLKYKERVNIIKKDIIPIFIWRKSLGSKYEYKLLKAEKVKYLSNIDVKDKIYLKRVKKILRLEEEQI